MLLTFIVLNVFAGDHNTVRLLSGSTDVFKESATAILEFDYSETTWEEDEIYELYCGDEYEERVNVSVKAFEKKFNITSKGLKIKKEDANAKYNNRPYTFTTEPQENIFFVAPSKGEYKVKVMCFEKRGNTLAEEEFNVTIIDRKGHRQDFSGKVKHRQTVTVTTHTVE